MVVLFGAGRPGAGPLASIIIYYTKPGPKNKGGLSVSAQPPDGSFVGYASFGSGLPFLLKMNF